MAGHTFQEHTGELEVRIQAASLGELLSEAARALAEIMAGPGEGAGAVRDLEVRIQSPDRNALLVDWLNELIFLSERDKVVFHDVHVEEVSDERLQASVRGREIEELRLHVKAATFHGLDIRQTPEGLVANLVLDV